MDKIQRTKPRTKGKSGFSKFLKVSFFILICIVMLMIGYLLAGILEAVFSY